MVDVLAASATLKPAHSGPSERGNGDREGRSGLHLGVKEADTSEASIEQSM